MVQQLLRRSKVNLVFTATGNGEQNPLKRYLLQQLLRSVQLLLVMLKAAFQVPDLLTLYLHLVCQNTYLYNGDASFLRIAAFLLWLDRAVRQNLRRQTWRMRHSLSFSSRDRRSW